MGFLRCASFTLIPLVAMVLGFVYTFDFVSSRGVLPMSIRVAANSLPVSNRAHNADYTQSDLPDMTGKTVLITGATSGIGFESARLLAARGARVVLGIRGTRERLDKVVASFEGNVLAPAPLDLADLNTVRGFAKALAKAGVDSLDVVMLNAAKLIFACGKTAEGLEEMLGAHHIGHAYLFELLMPTMLRASGEVRVVLSTSAAHMSSYPEGMRYDINGDNFSYMTAYGNSKLANIIYGRALAQRLGKLYPGKFVVNSAHPGWVASEFTAFNRYMPSLIAFNNTEGAMAILRPAVDKGVKTDGYYLPVGLRADWEADTAAWWTCNSTMREELWDWTAAALNKVHKKANAQAPEGALMLL